MKKFFRSIYNFFLKKKVNKKDVEYINFYNTFNQEYIKQILRHIAYNLHNNPNEIIPPLKLSDYYEFTGRSYFAGATFCLDIKVDGDKNPWVITITSDEKTVGWFSHTTWEGKPLLRNKLSPVEIGIYMDIYDIVKGNKNKK